MKIRFETPKQNVEVFKSRLQSGGARKGDYSLSVRDHKKNENLAVFELENRYQAIQPDFEQQLKSWEFKQQIIRLKIEQ